MICLACEGRRDTIHCERCKGTGIDPDTATHAIPESIINKKITDPVDELLIKKDFIVEGAVLPPQPPELGPSINPTIVRRSENPIVVGQIQSNHLISQPAIQSIPNELPPTTMKLIMYEILDEIRGAKNREIVKSVFSKYGITK